MVEREELYRQLDRCVDVVELPGMRDRYRRGKVRDIYDLGDKKILIATDRQSAFDVNVGLIPLKGQVLNRISAWWFGKVEDVVAHHLIAVPDPNVSLVQDVEVFPVEVVVRGYITGSTDTSAWVNYEKGVREFCGNRLPEGLVKNQKFREPIVTPTTKAREGHDEKISPEEIVSTGLMRSEDWDWVSSTALALFERGTELAAEQGLILVDTKYEFGRNREGQRILADEVHTPDSSRYWVAETYEDRFSQGLEPDSVDKEFLRLWLKERGIADGNVPRLDDDIRVEVAQKYVSVYEKLTGEPFDVVQDDRPGADRIRNNLEPYLPE